MPQPALGRCHSTRRTLDSRGSGAPTTSRETSGVYHNSRRRNKDGSARASAEGARLMNGGSKRESRRHMCWHWRKNGLRIETLRNHAVASTLERRGKCRKTDPILHPSLNTPVESHPPLIRPPLNLAQTPGDSICSSMISPGYTCPQSHAQSVSHAWRDAPRRYSRTAFAANSVSPTAQRFPTVGRSPTYLIGRSTIMCVSHRVYRKEREPACSSWARSLH
jgi:hypothetical protein